MNSDSDQFQQAIQEARIALRSGDQATARHWAEQAARLAPDSEEPWLVLAVVSEPRAALEYAKRALVINPLSQRARKAVDWARARPGAEEAPAEANPFERLPHKVASPPVEPAPEAEPALPEEPPSSNKPSRRALAYAVLLAGFICLVVAFAGWTATRSPAVASLLSANDNPLPTPTLAAYYAQADIAKPTYTAMPDWTATATATGIPTDTFTPLPSATLVPEDTALPLPSDTPLPTEMPTLSEAEGSPPTETPALSEAEGALPTETPGPSPTPGQMEMAIVPDTPTPVRPPTKAYVAPTQQAAAPSSGGVSYGTHWIDVNLSQQMVYAYEGDTVVNSFLASTGTWQYPTVTGRFSIYVKYLSTRMTGPGYDLPNVPYTMYFYKGYGIHGTYWHHNFGTPMSHGCVNLSIPDAEWLYYWSSVGTVVNIHY